MNVIVGNTQQDMLSSLDIDIIKSISGVFDAKELVTMFQKFFYNKMILDVTALSDAENIDTYKTLVGGIEADKIIFFVPEKTQFCTKKFIKSLVSVGIYNFTSNVDGIRYLLKHSNTLDDVKEFVSDDDAPSYEPEKKEKVSGAKEPAPVNKGKEKELAPIKTQAIIGVKSITESSGASTLIYMMKKELDHRLKSGVVAVEINKRDFPLFNEKNMASIDKSELRAYLDKNVDAKVILVDLNNYADGEKICTDVIYLLESSIIKLNRLLLDNPKILVSLKNKKVILNRSLLSNKDIFDFEYESGLKVFYNLPPLDERKRNAAIVDLLVKLRLIASDGQKDSGKVFGLFRK